MKSEKDINFIRHIAAQKYRLPNTIKLKINHITNENSDLAKFLINCAPSKIKQLLINNENDSFSTINSSFYIDSLSHAVSKATKEVYIKGFYFKRADLQKFIMAAHNVEKLVFDNCSIRCLKQLNFGEDIQYNIKYLSFQSCGDINSIYLKTHWIKTSKSFKNIIDAISECGLKNSLEKINIYKNQTLSTSLVKWMLEDQDIKSIDVIREKYISGLTL